VIGGMSPLLDDGKRKILRGITTPDEVVRIAQQEGVIDSEE
jgi:type II secretory ATPase GspE/PulE/Tfp pilus assembly ATPase PilB-like protein